MHLPATGCVPLPNTYLSISQLAQRYSQPRGVIVEPKGTLWPSTGTCATIEAARFWLNNFVNDSGS